MPRWLVRAVATRAHPDPVFAWSQTRCRATGAPSASMTVPVTLTVDPASTLVADSSRVTEAGSGPLGRVGDEVGEPVAEELGEVGEELGERVGEPVGLEEPVAVAPDDEIEEGTVVGGSTEAGATTVAPAVGLGDGRRDGSPVGLLVGFRDGLGVGVVTVGAEATLVGVGSGRR